MVSGHTIDLYIKKYKTYFKGKGIPITGHEGPRGMWIQGSTYSQPRHKEEVGWLVLHSATFIPGTHFIGG